MWRNAVRTVDQALCYDGGNIVSVKSKSPIDKSCKSNVRERAIARLAGQSKALCGRRVYCAASHFISACYHPVEMWLFWEFCSWPCAVLCCAVCLLLLCYVCSIVSRWK